MDSATSRGRYDVVVVGGGHNGLVAAAYLARAGRSVLVLERLPHVGGAARSAAVFTGQDARLSRFSYLVSLLPDRLVRELGLDLDLVTRRTSSYTPYTRDGRHLGLLVESPVGPATRASFRELTGSDAEYDAWRALGEDVATLARVVAPTLLEPLPTRRAVRAAVPERVWHDLVATPLAQTLESRFADDLVRGVLATDALIGSSAGLDDPTLPNQTFLHHVIGNGTGEWRVPVGGMGAVTAALERAAREAGATILTGAGVSRIDAGDDGAQVTWHDGATDHTVSCTHALAGVAPWVLAILLGRGEDPDTKPVGNQLKLNLLLTRLPRLRSGIDPAVAFAGTLHVAQSATQLRTTYADVAAGRLPAVLPGEVYCHTLSDPSIAPGGLQTLTYFGLGTPPSLFAGDHDAVKAEAVARALAALEEHLAEPLLDVVARDASGQPCIEALTPVEIEAELALPGGHIYHGDLDWPWAHDRARLDSPAERWGVQTDVASVLLCGSGARRGGGVSGIAGHNAARAVLENN